MTPRQKNHFQKVHPGLRIGRHRDLRTQRMNRKIVGTEELQERIQRPKREELPLRPFCLIIFAWMN
uniref:Uncharacterized protein n=1 Tax=Lepeophtheirus salmonis TaxID=72036 RepID=A0A0K2V9S3_LEPSM